MLDKHIFCRDISRQSGEQLIGTVGTRRAWLLLQDHSAWAIQAYAGCDLPAAVRQHLEPFFGREKPSILLIRNSDEKHLPSRKAFVVVSRNTRAELYEFVWHQPEDLMTLPYAGILDGSYQGDRAEPIYLVCTHGKRDKCCAKYGKPVYDYLRTRIGERVWRASHVGGDRFAANLVCLPHSLYYGRVTPEQALELVRKYEQGELDLEAVRGRSCYPKLTQAAEIFVRRHFDIRVIDQMRFVSHEPLEGARHRLIFADLLEGRQLGVDIEVSQSEFANFLTCRDDEKESVPLYHSLRFTETATESAHVLST